MSEEATPVPDAQTRPHRRLPLVWLIPLVAVLVGAWLAYENLSTRGPEFEITFRMAHGLEAGKTPIRYREVTVGIVQEVDVAADLSHVVVKARVNPLMGEHLVEGTRFWIVRPRIGAGGITGLSTLISGAYIAMDVGPDDAKRVKSFEGVEIPPIDVAGERGLVLVLETSNLRGVGDGSPVLYRDINVGEVLRYDLHDKDPSKVILHVLVRSKHASLVNSKTRFWNASGIDMAVGLGGVSVDVESLQSLLIGGVSFETFGAPGKPAQKNDRFHLYDNRKAVVAATMEGGGLRVVLDTPQLGSIEIGDPVYYREEQVGRVVRQSLHEDARSVGVLVEIAPRYAPLVRTNSVFWNASGIEGGLGWSGVTIHAESLESILRGGVAFATPDSPGPRARSGSVFELQAKGSDEWRNWSPRIWLGGGSDPSSPAKVEAPAEKVSPLSRSGRSDRYGGLRRGHGMKR